MVTQTRKQTRARFVSKQTVEQVGASLHELPAKTPDNHSLRQAIEQLRETIEAALAKGYSYEDLVPILAQQGIDIQPSTLKRYILTSPTRSTARRSSSGKTMQTRKQPAPTVTTEDTPVTAEVSAPAPTASRKKSTKAAAQEESPPLVPATRKRGRAAANVTPLPTATETVEATPKPSKQSRSRRTATASPAAAKSRATSTRGRKAAKA